MTKQKPDKVSWVIPEVVSIGGPRVPTDEDTRTEYEKALKLIRAQRETIMATKTAVQESGQELVTPAQLAALRVATGAVVSHMRNEIVDLIVEEAAHYAIADSLLSKIRKARMLVESKFAPTISPLKEGIAKIKKGLDALKALQQEILGPLDEGEKVIREKMQQYRYKEAALIREAALERSRESERLRREAEEKDRLLASARTSQMRAKIQERAAELATQRRIVESTPVAAPVRVAGSGIRKIRKWRVVDMAKLIESALDPEGIVPLEILVVDKAAVDAQFRVDPEGVAAFPGVEVYEDLIIVGRG